MISRQVCLSRVNVEGSRHGTVALVLDVRQLMGEQPRVVIVDERQDPDGLTRLLSPLAFHQLGP